MDQKIWFFIPLIQSPFYVTKFYTNTICFKYAVKQYFKYSMVQTHVAKIKVF